MTDWNEAASTANPVEDPIGSAAERGIEYVKTIAAELVEASRSAVQSVLDEQKEGAARQVGAFAAAVRSAAQSLDQSQSPTLAHYADQMAGGIERFGNRLRERGWSELADDIAGLAQRRPALFIAGAVIVGFVSGRFLWASKSRAALAPPVPETTAIERENEAVTAAVSSAPGEAGLAEHAAGTSGTQGMPQ
ncbi:MAG TPA: hypothetical protein VE993_20020 [Stellaceae bacterium]|nr:hypothetical protein [Stellaceae bacterium]